MVQAYNSCKKSTFKINVFFDRLTTMVLHQLKTASRQKENQTLRKSLQSHPRKIIKLKQTHSISTLEKIVFQKGQDLNAK